MEIFNNQFTLKAYLDKHNPNFYQQLLEFAKNNNVNIDYIGFIEIENGFITTNIIRKPNNGYREISIGLNNKDDTIIDYRRNGSYNLELEINYKGVNIKISKRYDDVSRFINIPIPISQLSTLKDNTLDYTKTYDKNVRIPHIVKIINVYEINKVFLSNFNSELVLRFGKSFNKDITKSMWPDDVNIKVIELNHFYRGNILGLPITLQRLVLNHSYNITLQPFVLPESCEELILGYSFNRKIGIDVLPKSLKKLRFGCQYDQELLPEVFYFTNIVELAFGEDFQQPIKPKVLPESLRVLRLKHTYKKYISDDTIPINLRMLVMPKDYCLVTLPIKKCYT